MSESYGYAYLTSYGWAGSGTGLRKGAIDRPLAIAPKKNLSGLGKDRDEAFPFWDHLFTAASKAITIKVSSDDEDVEGTEDPGSQPDPSAVPLRRTTTGIISNRRPTSGTPASTSGSTTPNPTADAAAPGRLSLLTIAKREAAKRSLYARFFRGPVLGPDDDSRLGLSSSSSESSPVPEHADDQDDVAGEIHKGEKRRSEDKAETKEERRERKRLRRERNAARAVKKAEKALAKEKAKKKNSPLDGADRKARKHQDKETRPGENEISLHPQKGRKKRRKSLAGSERDDLEPAECIRKELEPTNNERPDTTDAFNVDFTSKKKKRRRKDIPS